MPWLQTRMDFDQEEHEGRAQLVAERERQRQDIEQQQRQGVPVPETHRESLKKQAEKREQERIFEKVRQMRQDRQEAEKQRDRAFEKVRARKPEAHIRDKAIPPLRKELEEARELVEDFVKGKPEEQKTAEDRVLDEKAREAIKAAEALVEQLEKTPAESEAILEELENKKSELKAVARAAKERGDEPGEPAWKAAHAGTKLAEAAKQAQKQIQTAGELSNTDGAAKVEPAPGGAGQGAKGNAATSENYEAARELEQQTETLVNDARAAEIALRTGVPFAKAKQNLNTFSPERPDLQKPLQSNAAATIGQLNAFRESVAQAAATIDAMATRTAALTRGVASVQTPSAPTAQPPGSAEAAEGAMGTGSAGIGSSNGLRFTDVPFQDAGSSTVRKRVDAMLPKEMITKNALPGRMLTDASARKGWLYLDTWYVIGPWKVNYRDKFSDIHPPEYEVDFDAVYSDGKFADQPDHAYHQMRWQFVQSDEMAIQPPEVFGGETWYAYTEVYSDQTRQMLLAAASDDFAKIWLNGDVVWEDTENSAWEMGEAVRKVTFQQGYNRLLVRVGNGPLHMVWSVLISPPEVLEFVQSSSGPTFSTPPRSMP